MKTIRIKLLVLALLCLPTPVRSLAQVSAGPQQNGKHKTKVETNYDKKKNETIAQIGPFRLYRPPHNSVSGELNYERIDMLIAFSYPGKKIVKPQTVMLMVFATSEGGAKLEQEHRLSIKTDLGQYDLGEMEFLWKNEGHAPKTALGGGGVLLVNEAVRKSISFDEFARIARSEKAELKIGDQKVKLGKEHLKAFKDFVSLMEQEGLEF